MNVLPAMRCLIRHCSLYSTRTVCRLLEAVMNIPCHMLCAFVVTVCLFVIVAQKYVLGVILISRAAIMPVCLYHKITT